MTGNVFCIYTHKCLATGRSYIGVTKNDLIGNWSTDLDKLLFLYPITRIENKFYEDAIKYPNPQDWITILVYETKNMNYQDIINKAKTFQDK